MKKIKFSLNGDPTTGKVVAIGILLTAESFLSGVLTTLSNGVMPTQVQWCTIGCISLLQLVTFLSTFLRTGEVPQKGKNK